MSADETFEKEDGSNSLGVTRWPSESVDLTSLDMRLQRFIGFMLIYGHEPGGPSRAYKEAGYKSVKYPDQMVQKILKRPEVQSALTAAQSQHASKIDVKADRVLQELALIAFSDISQYQMDEHGMLEINEMYSPAVSRAIQSVEYTETRMVGRDESETITRKMKVKLWDKNVALTNLMKYLGMLVNQNINMNLNGKMPLDMAREAIAKAREAHALPLQFATDKERMTEEDNQTASVSKASDLAMVNSVEALRDKISEVVDNSVDFSIPNQREMERIGGVNMPPVDIIGEEEEGPTQPPNLEDNWMEEDGG